MPSLAAFTAAAVVLAAPALSESVASPEIPSTTVPACPESQTVSYNYLVPDQTKDFPLTTVGLCYTSTHLSLTFTAYNETNFYFDPSQGTNDDIYNYEVMEAFIYKGTDDPATYFEYEVNPNNVTYNAFVYNPSKDRADDAPFDDILLTDPAGDGLSATTSIDKPGQTWTSKSQIPLALFNVDDGQAKGTQWRMNFFRTVTSPQTYPNQVLGAWSPPNEPSFHITKYFGHVEFV